jgi:uncharacterized membrane protein YhaH (DUF805 family)
MKRHLSFHGRANINEYVATGLGLGVLWVLAFAATSALVGFALAGLGVSGDVIAWVVIAVFALTYTFAVVAQAALTVRRLHDIGVSGRWFVVLFLLPGLALVLALSGLQSLAFAVLVMAVLLNLAPTFLPGSPNSNRFGDPPLGDAWRQATMPAPPAPKPNLDEQLATARRQLEQTRGQLRL